MRFFSPTHDDLITVTRNPDSSYTVEISHSAVLTHFYADNPREKKLPAAVIIANLFNDMDLPYKNESNKSVLTLSSKQIEKLTGQLGNFGFQTDYQTPSRNLALMSTEQHTETVHKERMRTLAVELRAGIYTQQATILAKDYLIRR